MSYRVLAIVVLVLAGNASFVGNTYAGDRIRLHVDERGDRTIIPGYRVGPIKADTSEAHLIQLFGANNLLRMPHNGNDAGIEQITRLFAGGWSTVQIHWLDNFRKISRVIIRGQHGPWKTSRGITIGTTLATLERLNGRPFLIAGFSWHYGGWVVSWENGKLPETLRVRLAPSNKVSDLQFWEVMGPKSYPSRHWVYRNMDLRVDALSIQLHEDKSSALNQ